MLRRELTSQEAYHPLPRLHESEREIMAGVKPSLSYYSYDCEDEESLERAHNVSVYGNPLWTEERNPYHIKEIVDTAATNDRQDDHIIADRHTSAATLEEPDYRPTSSLLQSDHLMYSSDSSNGEDPKQLLQDDIKDAPFWRSRSHDVESRSTSQNSSDFELNSSSESRDFYEQHALTQGNLEANKLGRARRFLRSDEGNLNMCGKLAEDSCALKEGKGRDVLRNKMLLPKHEEKRVSESDPSNVMVNSESWSKFVSETVFKESSDLQARGLEQCIPTSNNANALKRGYKDCPLSHQQRYDLAASDGKNIFANFIANNRQGMFWSNQSFKRDMSRLSPQEEDYLYQNSDMFASFEVEDYGATNKRTTKEIKLLAKEGLIQDLCEEYEAKLLLEQNDSAKNEGILSEFCDVNNSKEKGQFPKKTKEITHFDDASSWSSHNSEDFNLQCHSNEVLNGFDTLTINDCANLARERKNEGNLTLVKSFTTVSALPMPVESARSNTTLLCHRGDDKALISKPQQSNLVEKVTGECNVVMPMPVDSAGLNTGLNTGLACYRVDDKALISRPQAFDMAEKVTRESNMTMTETDIKGLEQEISELRRDNGRLAKLLKESEQKLENFSNERVLWEQKKLSEMSIFNAFKEEETQRLKRERARLEKQTKLLAQLPSKKERNEIEELRTKIANLTSEHAKNHSLQNLTINRLRKTITDLTDQIYALQEEVRRYERFLHSELDANQDCRRKLNLPRVTVAEKLQSFASEHEQDEQSSNNLMPKDKNSQCGSNWSRVSTAVHWTRA